ncbi:MAG: XdhC/CoxI family protein, partial [Candidatus Zixiibacteriota bacterium]
GWQVTVADHRADFAAPRRFPSADSVLLVDNARIDEKLNLSQHDAVVIMTHNYFQDRLLLQQVLLSDVPYIGLLGAAKRSERILEEIKQSGLKVTDAQYARLYTPVGLNLGADGPEEIALSILAEIQAVLSKKTGTSLRDCVTEKSHA